MGRSKDSVGSSKKTSEHRTNAEDLRRALNWILVSGIFHDLKLHGNVSWQPIHLVRLAVFWVWSDESSLVAAANEAIKKVTKLFGFSAVESYQGLSGALKRYTTQLLPRLWGRLHCLMEKCDESSWRVGLWLALAVDGSRISVPRTEKNERAYCKAKKKGKKRKKKKRGRHAGREISSAGRRKKHYDPQAVGPQMWLTLIWHLGLQLPWSWKVGPSYSSERGHVLAMLEAQEFPEKTLFCGDAGFVGYDFLKAIADHGHHFLVRVGGNVRLLKKLGYARQRDGIVYCWPDTAMKSKQPPLVLRLIHFRTGRGDVFLVTNVLNEKQLSAKQAAEIYRRRWGIELQFRTIKQTFNRSKLRSKTPDCAEVELHWSLIGLWMLQLLALKEQTTIGEPRESTSMATVLRIVRSIIQDLQATPAANESFKSQLATATTDSYQRKTKKKSRNYPRRKEEPATGKPKITLATAEHKRKLRQIQNLTNAI